MSEAILVGNIEENRVNFLLVAGSWELAGEDGENRETDFYQHFELVNQEEVQHWLRVLKWQIDEKERQEPSHCVHLQIKAQVYYQVLCQGGKLLEKQHFRLKSQLFELLRLKVVNLNQLHPVKKLYHAPEASSFIEIKSYQKCRRDKVHALHVADPIRLL